MRRAIWRAGRRALSWAVGILWCVGVFVIPVVLIQLLILWFDAGYVRIEPGSEHLELTGVPGDRIKLRLPLPADAHADYRETSAVIVDPETGVETVTRLDVRLDDAEAPDRVFAWLTVPEVPPRTSRTLDGSLSGLATTSKGTIGRFEVPFTLRVGPRGTIATSGAKDMTWQNRVKKAALVALAVPLVLTVALAVPLVVAIAAALFLRFFLWVAFLALLGWGAAAARSAARGGERQAAAPELSPEPAPSTSPGRHAPEGV